MRWKNNNDKLMVATILFTELIFSTNSQAAFYQADTFAEYCTEYIKIISLEKSANQFEAGVCSGYIASKIEVMDLSGQLCRRETINLNDVAKDYVTYVSDNSNAREHSATYILVDLLQRKYACEE